MSIAVPPTRPSSWANTAKMKSVSATGMLTVPERPRPVPASPPSAMAKIDWAIWYPSPDTSAHGSSHTRTRRCTWPNMLHATTDPSANNPLPTTRYDTRWVATHSITMNRAKNSSDDPRSVWYIITSSDTPQATSTGPRCLGSGIRRRPTPHDPSDSSSRFSTR